VAVAGLAAGPPGMAGCLVQELPRSLGVLKEAGELLSARYQGNNQRGK
jgi:hypothetical protein